MMCGSDINRLDIKVTIMAHEKRKAQALELEQKLKSQGADVDITWDEINRQWDTGKRALEKGIGKDWLIILEDDAVIGDNFYQNALRAIESVPEQNMISFYTGTLKPFRRRVHAAVRRASIDKASWLSFNTLNWGVGIAIRGHHIKPLLDRVKKSELPYDEKIGYYFKRSCRKVYYTYPSIISHRDGEPINKGKPKGARVAHVFSDELLEFNNTVVPM